MDSQIEQRVCITFCVKLCKSATGILKMLHEAFREYSLAENRFLSGIHVSRRADCQLKMTKFQGFQAPAKRQKMLKNSTSHPRRPWPNNP
jgi:hypothetical protein